MRGNTISHACPKCGTVFPVQANRLASGRGKFCSKACYWAAGAGPKSRPAVDRFWEKVARTDDLFSCWLWTAAKGNSGYGIFVPNHSGPNANAHRFSYELHYGPIPEGLWVCHRCDVRLCVRPDHLFLGTPTDNYADMQQKGRVVPAGVAVRPALRGPAHPSWGKPNPSARGENCWNTKLTDDLVRTIRQRVANGEMQKTLVREFGLSQMVVSRLVRRESWTHIE